MYSPIKSTINHEFKDMEMNNQNYTNGFTVHQSPAEVFNAIKNVRGWWSEEIVGHADKVGDKFTHSVLDLHRCDLQVTELVPNDLLPFSVPCAFRV